MRVAFAIIFSLFLIQESHAQWHQRLHFSVDAALIEGMGSINHQSMDSRYRSTTNVAHGDKGYGLTGHVYYDINSDLNCFMGFGYDNFMIRYQLSVLDERTSFYSLHGYPMYIDYMNISLGLSHTLLRHQNGYLNFTLAYKHILDKSDGTTLLLGSYAHDVEDIGNPYSNFLAVGQRQSQYWDGIELGLNHLAPVGKKGRLGLGVSFFTSIVNGPILSGYMNYYGIGTLDDNIIDQYDNCLSNPSCSFGSFQENANNMAPDVKVQFKTYLRQVKARVFYLR